MLGGEGQLVRRDEFPACHRMMHLHNANTVSIHACPQRQHYNTYMSTTPTLHRYMHAYNTNTTTHTGPQHQHYINTWIPTTWTLHNKHAHNTNATQQEQYKKSTHNLTLVSTCEPKHYSRQKFGQNAPGIRMSSMSVIDILSLNSKGYWTHIEKRIQYIHSSPCLLALHFQI